MSCWWARLGSCLQVYLSRGLQVLLTWTMTKVILRSNNQTTIAGVDKALFACWAHRDDLNQNSVCLHSYRERLREAVQLKILKEATFASFQINNKLSRERKVWHNIINTNTTRQNCVQLDGCPNRKHDTVLESKRWKTIILQRRY